MLWIEFLKELARKEPDDWLASGWSAALREPDADALSREIAHRLMLGPTDTLLDVGAGVGPLTRRLAPRVARAVAIEPSRAALERGSRSGGGIEWRSGDWTSLEADCEVFSRVLAYQAAQRISSHSELRDLLAVLANATAPDGLILLGQAPDQALTRAWRTGERGRDENRTEWVGRLELREAEMKRLAIEEDRLQERRRALGIPEPPPERRQGFVRDVVARICRETAGEPEFLRVPSILPTRHTSLDVLIHKRA